jgi:hypothetical protein
VIALTLDRRIVIKTSERLLFEALRFLECVPDIQSAPALETVVTVEPYRGRYRICEEGMDDQEVLGIRALVEHLQAKVLSLSFQSNPRAGVLHAASLRRGYRRILITGGEATGKTTLSLRLIRAGCDFEGDENVFLEDDGVIARPRACRVKETSLALLPEIADVISASPCEVDYFGRTIFNVDPRSIGGTWRIEKGHVDCIVVLRPNHGGYSSIRPMPPLPLSQALISEFGLREAGRGAAIATIAKLVSNTNGFDLSLGDHETAIECIDRVLNG